MASSFGQIFRITTWGESHGGGVGVVIDGCPPGVESLINHPILMTHGAVPPEMRAALGISDSLVRLSVGVEDVNDLIDDLRTAFAAI